MPASASSLTFHHLDDPVPDDGAAPEDRTPVRLVATDIDGTILPYRGAVSPRTRSALAAVVERGAHLVYATGRPPRWMPPIVEATGQAGLAICANGAIVVETATGAVVDLVPIVDDLVGHAAAALRRAVPDVRLAVETTTSFWVEDGYLALRGGGRPEGLTPAQAPGDPRLAGHIEDVPERDGTFKVLAITGSLTMDEFLAAARDTLEPDLAVTASSPGNAIVELAAPGVSKGAALATVAARLGIEASQVAAFGDMPNDVEMLGWAGHGFAMDGGHPTAIAAATRTAPPSADDGVARVLEGMVASGRLQPATERADVGR
ncbi:HAD family hydrolase [Georgenia subflava]|uniref:HAD family hydrolase n=1 Tax=Georgenia subflava TaxID=1622177 RepID=UPI00186B3B41|nr:HAD family hydrolase [Georgenia subflava]